MKHLFLAVTALSLAGTIGTANADPVLGSNSIEIWSGANPSPGDGTNASQQGLPNATAAFSSGPLPLVSAPPGLGTYMQPINYNETNSSTGAPTIGGFFTSVNSAQPLPGNCPSLSACAGTTISIGQGTPAAAFQNATVMEFNFTAATAETLTITHDDGISIFVAGNEGNGGPANALVPTNETVAQASMPQNANQFGPTMYSLGPGNFDLWYNEDNGLPAVLDATFTPVVPAPLIGHGLLVLLAVGGVLFGGKLLESLKKRNLHAA